MSSPASASTWAVSVLAVGWLAASACVVGRQAKERPPVRIAASGGTVALPTQVAAIALPEGAPRAAADAPAPPRAQREEDPEDFEPAVELPPPRLVHVGESGAEERVFRYRYRGRLQSGAVHMDWRERASVESEGR